MDTKVSAGDFDRLQDQKSVYAGLGYASILTQQIKIYQCQTESMMHVEKVQTFDDKQKANKVTAYVL